MIHANLTASLLVAQLVFVTGIDAENEVLNALFFIFWEFPFLF